MVINRRHDQKLGLRRWLPYSHIALGRGLFFFLHVYMLYSGASNSAQEYLSTNEPTDQQRMRPSFIMFCRCDCKSAGEARDGAASHRRLEHGEIPACVVLRLRKLKTTEVSRTHGPVSFIEHVLLPHPPPRFPVLATPWNTCKFR